MKFLLGLLFSCTAATAFMQNVVSLVPPVQPLVAGGRATLDWIAVNPTAAETAFDAPRAAEAVLRGPAGEWPVSLRATELAPAQVAPGGFAHRTYTLELPAGAVGLLVLEVRPPDAPPLRAVLDVQAQAADATPSPEPSRISSFTQPAPAASAIVRTFAGRLAPHEPVYFIYGPDAPAAKFQFSFRYRLLTLAEHGDGISPDSVQFGFTQRSLWEIDEDSSPFYDTSYMPELIFESLAPMREPLGGWLTFLGYQFGLRHESNGRDGDISRSLNQAYLRPVVAVGPLDGWHLLVVPEVFAYVGGLSNNPQLDDYRGYGQLRLVLGRNDGPSLMVTTWAGKDFDYASVQLDLTVPIRTRILDFETYLLVQYFSGYGESLLSYDRESETVRAGLSFVR